MFSKKFVPRGNRKIAPRRPGRGYVRSDRLARRAPRPRTRGECLARALRPCPFISCRHHAVTIDIDSRARLTIDARRPNTRSIDAHASGRESEAFTDDISDAVIAMPVTCTLDVADRDERTLQEIANVVGVTRERIRQIEASALKHLKRRKRTIDGSG